MNVQIAPTWSGLLDDTVSAGAAPAAHAAARALPAGALLGALRVDDEALPALRDCPYPVHVRLGGGAGQVAGPARLASRSGLQLAGLELALRDLDDLGSNVRRVVAAVDSARDEGLLDDEVPVHVEIPVPEPSAAWGNPSGGWLRAADEAGAAELRLTLRLGGSHTDRFASAGTVAAWLDAALDRELPMRFIGATTRAVTHPVHVEDGTATAFGFANVLLATRRAFDGAGPDAVSETLRCTDPTVVAQWLSEEEFLGATRRWVTGWAGPAGQADQAEALVTAAATDLHSLGQLPHRG